MARGRTVRVLGVVAAAWAAVAFIGTGFRVLADCSAFDLPFSDLGSTAFCAQIAEAYFTGLSNGTSATTYSPSANVPREQMAAFVTRTLDQSLLRGNRRAALDQWWTQTPHYDKASLGLTSTVKSPRLLKSDGADLWVADHDNNSVERVRASDGSNLATVSGPVSPFGVLVAMGKIFISGETTPGSLFMIDPTSNTPFLLANILGNSSVGIAFDGNRVWTANLGGSVSIVTPGATMPWTVLNVAAGFSAPEGILFDGSNIWVTDNGAGTLLKLDSGGAILQTVTVGSQPGWPAFDGHNIWVPNNADSSVTVVRASDGTVLKTFSAGNGDQNGLNQPIQAAFDGQRILVTNMAGGLSLFKATDLSIIGNLATPGVTSPFGVCSDGVNFWVTFLSPTTVGRF